jgi:cell division protein FtsI (penicillin-binding protein 3)
MMRGSRRDSVIFGLIVLAFSALLFGAWRVMIEQSAFLQQEGDKRQIRHVTLPAARGPILDRRGDVVAMSTPMISVAIDPKTLKDQPDYQTSLASALKMPLEVVQEKIEANANKRFYYLKRGLAPHEAQLIEGLPLEGVHLVPEFKRFYPSGEVMSHVIGFTNIDDNGIEGIELSYNDWLKGSPGVRKVIRDNLGRVIETVDEIRPAHEGKPLSLSIDRDLQFFAYRALKRAMIEHQAKAAELVLLDVKTGEILAMVSQPGFNPNDRSQVTAAQTRNRVVTDVFEPGSTIKPIVIAGALELGSIKPDAVIDTGNGKYKSNDKLVRDHHGYGQLDLAGILRKSSNVGMVKIVEGMSREEVWRFLHFSGIGQETGIVFPGEQTGRLRDPLEWYPVTKTTAAYGYGYNVTLLQLARAYAVLANDGVLLPSTLIKLEGAVPQGKRVFKSEHARLLVRMMEEVVGMQGTGRKAAIPGYRVAGKTGTTRKANKGYDSDKYRAVFVGIAPATAPRFVLAVTVEEPSRGQYYGGEVAAPIFKEVMEETLRLMAIAPDDVAR